MTHVFVERIKRRQVKAATKPPNFTLPSARASKENGDEAHPMWVRASLNDELAKDYKSSSCSAASACGPKTPNHASPCGNGSSTTSPPASRAPKGKTCSRDWPDSPNSSPKPIPSSQAMPCSAPSIRPPICSNPRSGQSRDFKENGGSAERLHATRIQARAQQEGVPLCPVCGKRMRRRTAGKTSSQFWGCSAYPNCKGTRHRALKRPPKPSDKSDWSDWSELV